jgi:hypothetical protein
MELTANRVEKASLLPDHARVGILTRAGAVRERCPFLSTGPILPDAETAPVMRRGCSLAADGDFDVRFTHTQ